MKKYKVLMNGRNFLLSIDEKLQKHGFYQYDIIEADNPNQAKLLAVAKIWHDRGLKEATLNPGGDPPMIHLDTFWELDILDDPGFFEPGRTFYVEKKWWQFWKGKFKPQNNKSARDK